jgi:hypothetical protein
MPSLSISSGYPRFADTVGAPLEGKLYFGLPNQNPITSPKAVFWDQALTQPAAQPLNVSGGYIMRAGTPAGVFTDGDYSILAQDRLGRTVFYAKSSSEFDNGAKVANELVSLQNSIFSSKKVNNIAALRQILKGEAIQVEAFGYYNAGDNGGGVYYYDASDVTSIDNGGTIIVASAPTTSSSVVEPEAISEETDLERQRKRQMQIFGSL